MVSRIGINGFGRIGRMVFRRALTLDNVEVIAINDQENVADLAYLFKYDSVHGTFPGEIFHDEQQLWVNGKPVRCFSEARPDKIPWAMTSVDVVIESTGRFCSRDAAAQHLKAGAQKVLISAPAVDADVTLVPGVNDAHYDSKRHHVISMGSCTTNSLAPVAKVLLEQFGIAQLFITTVHAYTGGQPILDVPSRQHRQGRAGALSMIPATTGAAVATALVLPELEGKMDGMAIRVPIPDVSVTDIVAQLETPTSADAVNARLREASKRAPLKGILSVCDEELVSVDMIGNPHSSIVDALSTKVLNGTMVKLLAWYDNEWGYACRLAELANRLHS